MQNVVNTFVGRKNELERWTQLLNDEHTIGQAVVVIGKYGMGKTFLLDEMLKTAVANPALQCVSLRYTISSDESPGMVLRTVLDDMFQAARYEVGTLDPEGKRFLQWTEMYRRFGLFQTKTAAVTNASLKLLDRIRFDHLKNTFEQFSLRLKLFSDLLPTDARLLFTFDPELDTPATRVQLWTKVVQKLPPKCLFLFAQRYKDSLASDVEFRQQKNVHFIPNIENGLGNLSENEVTTLIGAYIPLIQAKVADKDAFSAVFKKYGNHPFAVHAALNLLLTDSFHKPEELPQEPMPQVVCPLQWKAVQEHPLSEDAVPILLSYAVLNVPSLDEMICWVADVSAEKLQQFFADPFLRSLIRDNADGRIIYHHYLTAFLRNQLYTSNGQLTELADNLYQRALMGYRELFNRTVKPNPQITVRMCETALIVGGPVLFAVTLCQSADAFFNLGFYQMFASLIDRALALIDPKSPEGIDLHYHLGKLRQRQQDYRAAAACYNDSLKLARAVGHTDKIARALTGLAQVALEQNLYNEAEKFLQEAKNKYEAIENWKGLTDTLLLAAELLSNQGRYQETEAVLDRVLQITHRIKSHQEQTKVMTAIYAARGKMFDMMGQIDRSVQEYHKAIDLVKDLYDRENEAELRFSVGSVLERIGNLQAAEENLTLALTMHRDMKLMENLAEDSINLSRIAVMQGRPEIAEQRKNEALDIFRQLGNHSRLQELEDADTL